MAAAEPEVLWHLQLEPMYMGVLGNDETVAATGSFVPGVFSRVGIEGDYDEDLAIRGELQRTLGNGWGFGVNGFWFAPEGTENAASNDPNVFFATKQGATLAQGGPATLNVKSELDVWSVDLYVMRTLVDNPNNNVHVLLGAKIAELEDHLTLRGDGSMGSSTVMAESDTNTMVGPFVGIAGDVLFGPHRIEGLLTQSALVGEAKYSSHQEIFGLFPFVDSFRGEKDTVVPMSEMRIKYLYDVSDNVSLGAGGYVGVWWDAPVAPITSFADTREATLTFLGAQLSAQMRW
jgi:hypothetical protein